MPVSLSMPGRQYAEHLLLLSDQGPHKYGDEGPILTLGMMLQQKDKVQLFTPKSLSA